MTGNLMAKATRRRRERIRHAHMVLPRGSSVFFSARCLLLSVICDLRKKKRIIIEARENKGFVCTEQVWGYCTLTNEINAGGYLYLSWYSKGNLGSVCLVAD